jgi:hypothetical protein
MDKRRGKGIKVQEKEKEREIKREEGQFKEGRKNLRKGIFSIFRFERSFIFFYRA